jgi:hypothetical protein
LSCQIYVIILDKMDENLVAKLAAMEEMLKENEGKLEVEKRIRKESEDKLKSQMENSKRDEVEQRRLRVQMFESQEKMRKEIESREMELDIERLEKEATMELLREKEEQLTEMINR